MRQELTAEGIPQPHSLGEETLHPSSAPPGRSHTVAYLFSQLFHPMISATLSFLIVGIFSTPSRLVGLAWGVLCILLLVIPTTLFYVVRLRQGVYSDEDVSDRHQRHELYFVSIVTVFVSIALLLLINAPVPLIALLTIGALLNLTNWLINLFWKISIHSSLAALSATVGMLHLLPLGLVLWFCTLLVGWSRVRTHNHTTLQVIAGICVATSLTLSVFTIFGLL